MGKTYNSSYTERILNEDYDIISEEKIEHHNVEPTDYEVYKEHFINLKQMYGDKAKFREDVECGRKIVIIEIQLDKLQFRRYYELKEWNV